MIPKQLVKIAVQTSVDGLSGGSPERLFAVPVEGVHDQFEIHNSPFYAKGISYLDVVEAVDDEEAPGHLHYARTIQGGGHSTYRILIEKGQPSFPSWWERLEDTGCTYEFTEEGAHLLYAVDVPPKADIYTVYRILQEGEDLGVWTFDEGHCGHPLRGTNA